MRVLYDYQAFSMQTHGGVSRCFAELYKHMPEGISAKISVRESDNVYVKDIEGIMPADYRYDHFICREDFYDKGHLHLWYDRLVNGGYYPDYNKNYSIDLLKEGNFDVFHPTFFDDYFLPYLNGKPFVLTIHDMIPWLYSSADHPNWKWQVLKMKNLVPLASAIIAVSENTKKDIIRLLNVPESKIHVVCHGSSLPMIKGEPHFLFPYILYVGDRGGYKNFIPFLRSMLPVLNRNKELRIVCTGKPFSQEERILIHENVMDDRIHVCWVKTDEELFSLYHYAQCFVFPSEYEGFGIPILEAYQAGCPVLLNRTSCFPEIAGDAAIYFELNSKSSNLAEKVEQLLLMTSDERSALIEKQKVRLANYSWKASAKQMAAIYQSLC